MRNRVFNRIEDKKKSMVFVFLFNLAFVYIVAFNYIHTGNLKYQFEELHYFDSRYFSTSPDLIALINSPRYISNYLVSIFMRITGLEWIDVANIFINTNYVLYAFLITYLSKSVKMKYRFIASFTYGMALMLPYVLPPLGSQMYWGESVTLGKGGVLAYIAIAIVLGKEKKWNISWILLTLAGVCHIHEGMYGGVLVFAIFVAYSFSHKKVEWRALVTFPIYVLMLLVSVLPNLTNSVQVNEERFIKIYAIICSGTHLDTKNWGIWGILQYISIILIAGLIVFIKGKDKEDYLESKYMSFFMVLLSTILIVISHISIYVCPNSTIASMSLSRCFKFIMFWAIWVIVNQGVHLIEEKKLLTALAFFGVLMFPKPIHRHDIYLMCLILLLVVVLLYHHENIQIKHKMDERICILLILLGELFVVYEYVISYTASTKYTNNEMLALYVIIAALCLACNGCWFWICEEEGRDVHKTKILYVLLTVFIILCSYGKLYEIKEKHITFIGGEEKLYNACDHDLYGLAKEFKDKSMYSDLILANPDGVETAYFQMISERAIYCSNYNRLGNKDAYLKWYDRLLLVRKLLQSDAKQINGYMKDNDIQYLLLLKNDIETDKEIISIDEIKKSNLFTEYMENESAIIFRVNLEETE